MIRFFLVAHARVLPFSRFYLSFHQSTTTSFRDDQLALASEIIDCNGELGPDNDDNDNDDGDDDLPETYFEIDRVSFQPRCSDWAHLPVLYGENLSLDDDDDNDNDDNNHDDDSLCYSIQGDEDLMLPLTTTTTTAVPLLLRHWIERVHHVHHPDISKCCSPLFFDSDHNLWSYLVNKDDSTKTNWNSNDTPLVPKRPWTITTAKLGKLTTGMIALVLLFSAFLPVRQRHFGTMLPCLATPTAPLPCRSFVVPNQRQCQRLRQCLDSYDADADAGIWQPVSNDDASCACPTVQPPVVLQLSPFLDALDNLHAAALALWEVNLDPGTRTRTTHWNVVTMHCGNCNTTTHNDKDKDNDPFGNATTALKTGRLDPHRHALDLWHDVDLDPGATNAATLDTVTVYSLPGNVTTTGHVLFDANRTMMIVHLDPSRHGLDLALATRYSPCANLLLVALFALVLLAYTVCLPMAVLFFGLGRDKDNPGPLGGDDDDDDYDFGLMHNDAGYDNDDDGDDAIAVADDHDLNQLPDTPPPPPPPPLQPRRPRRARRVGDGSVGDPFLPLRRSPRIAARVASRRSARIAARPSVSYVRMC